MKERLGIEILALSDLYISALAAGDDQNEFLSNFQDLRRTAE
jgi:hypothetical protein